MWRKSLFIIVQVLFIYFLTTQETAVADDTTVRFPTKQKEIEESLSRDTMPDKGLRTRGILLPRGVEGIVKDQPIPKVGAMIHFDYDSARIRPESYPLIDEFGRAFSGQLKHAVFIVAGHTDSDGLESHNTQLSYSRAKAVADYLVSRHNITSNRLIIKGYGKSQPIANNATQEGKAKNRRVEFIRED